MPLSGNADCRTDLVAESPHHSPKDVANQQQLSLGNIGRGSGPSVKNLS